MLFLIVITSSNPGVTPTVLFLGLRTGFFLGTGFGFFFGTVGAVLLGRLGFLGFLGFIGKVLDVPEGHFSTSFSSFCSVVVLTRGVPFLISIFAAINSKIANGSNTQMISIITNLTALSITSTDESL